MEFYVCVITIVYIILCVYRSYTKYILGNGPCLLDYVRRNERNQSVVNGK